jgi:hypothetical protein
LSGTSSSIKTELRWNSHWMVLFQNGVRHLVRGRDHQTQIWFRGFGGEDLNVIFYQNMPNLHNREKRGDEILIVHCCFSVSQNFNCSYMARSSLTYIPGFLWNFSFSRYIPIMQIRHKSFQQSLVDIGLVVFEEKIFF